MLASSPGRSCRRALPAGGLERRFRCRGTGEASGGRRRGGGSRPARRRPSRTSAPRSGGTRRGPRRSPGRWGWSTIPRVVYLDTETTGFGKRAEIVDIAVVGAAGKVLFESLVQPTRRIPADAIAIHGITNADVKDAPEWCDVYDEVLRGAGRAPHRRLQRDVRQADGDPGVRAVRPGRARGGLGVRDEALRRVPRELGSGQALVPVPEAGARRARPSARNRAGIAPPPTPSPAAPWCWGWRRPRRRGWPPPVDMPAVDIRRSWHVPAEAPRSTRRASPSSRSRICSARWRRAAQRVLRAGRRRAGQSCASARGPAGTWSVREVVAHCAGWEWEGARRCA